MTLWSIFSIFLVFEWFSVQRRWGDFFRFLISDNLEKEGKKVEKTNEETNAICCLNGWDIKQAQCIDFTHSSGSSFDPGCTGMGLGHGLGWVWRGCTLIPALVKTTPAIFILTFFCISLWVRALICRFNTLFREVLIQKCFVHFCSFQKPYKKTAIPSWT